MSGNRKVFHGIRTIYNALTKPTNARSRIVTQLNCSNLACDFEDTERRVETPQPVSLWGTCPEKAPYPGTSANFTKNLKIQLPTDYEAIPIYRVMRKDGDLVNADQHPELSKDELRKWYRCMVLVNAIDETMQKYQSLLSIYLTNCGEEGIQIGSAAALDNRDLIFAQYREMGVLLFRGFQPEQFMAQCVGSSSDAAHGRQMPMMTGSKDINFVTISPTLATQMPQAAGAAYAYKRAQNGQVVVCYFGEGTASEGDAHAAFNFAATLDCPVIFICRNNGYAISTPAKEQYRGDGIASRAPGYGMATIRVDGNDVLAVYNATVAAREYVLTEMKPILIEAMNYRIADHSLGLNSSLYRSEEEVDQFRKHENPVARFRNYLLKNELWDADMETALVQEYKTLALDSFQKIVSQKRPSPTHTFTDVYDTMPPHIQRQLEELQRHVQKYPENYPLDLHEPFLSSDDVEDGALYVNPVPFLPPKLGSRSKPPRQAVPPPTLVLNRQPLGFF